MKGKSKSKKKMCIVHCTMGSVQSTECPIQYSSLSSSGTYLISVMQWASTLQCTALQSTGVHFTVENCTSQQHITLTALQCSPELSVFPVVSASTDDQRAQHKTTQTHHNTTQHNIPKHNNNTKQHNTTQHKTKQHKTTEHNTTQHNTKYICFSFFLTNCLFDLTGQF